MSKSNCNQLKDENLQLMIKNEKLRQENEKFQQQQILSDETLSTYKKEQNQFIEKIQSYDDSINQVLQKIDDMMELIQEKDKNIEILTAEKVRFLEEKGILLRENNNRNSEIQQMKQVIESLQKMQIQKPEDNASRNSQPTPNI